MMPNSLIIRPGGSKTVTLSLRPEQAGTLSGTLEILTNVDPIRLSIQEVTIALPPPVVAVGQERLDFGELVFLGDTKAVSFEVQNTGGSDLKLTGIQSSLTGVSMTPNNLTIPAGGSESVTVTLMPEQAGTLSGTLEILTNVDPIRMSIRELTAQVPLPTIVVTEQGLDFGQGDVGRALQRSFTVRNDGQGDLQVKEIRSGLSGLSVSQKAFTVSPGESKTVMVTVRLDSEGSFSGVLEIVSDDPNQEVVTVSLSGTAILVPVDVRADFDANGRVEFAGFLGFARAFGSADATFDLDGSGKVDFPYFLVFARSFGKTAN